MLAATNGLPAEANSKHRDAAPVLFGRAASAADQVRRLASLNAKLGGRQYLNWISCEYRIDGYYLQIVLDCLTHQDSVKWITVMHLER